MDSRNLDKAIEIYARLIQGETIAKASRENSALYEDYYGNAEVYEIVGNLLKKLNLVDLCISIIIFVQSTVRRLLWKCRGLRDCRQFVKETESEYLRIQ